MSHPAYDVLTHTWTRLHHFSHLQAIVGWDRAAIMPPKGNAARANAMAEMDALLHRLRTDASLAAQIARANDEMLDDVQRANLREIERDWRAANALPEALVQAQSLAAARCEHAWRSQRPANDWAGFLKNFSEVLKLGRESAKRLADDTGLDLYDALMDQFEPGMKCAEVDRVFEPFHRLTATGSGAGLGLAIVREVVQQHGGRAFVDVTHAPGARVVLDIPDDAPR